MAGVVTWAWGLLTGNGSADGDVKQPKIIAFGNVLLDRTIKLQNTELLERYQLKLGSKGELDAAVLAEITADASESGKCIVDVGGAALNTVKILRQLGRSAVLFGAVGADDDAQKLREMLAERNVWVELETIEDTPTGMAMCLVYNDENALFASIGASKKLTIDFVRQQILPYLEKLRILYIEGFFVPEREEVCHFIVRNYLQEKRQLAFNLSGVYIVEQNFDAIEKLAHSCFFLFGNEQEFEALKERMNCKTNVDLTQAFHMSEVPKLLFITKGADGVIVISNTDNGARDIGETQLCEYKAKKVNDVVDSTGAGDAFVAGFLQAWLQKRQLSECVRFAIDTAANVCTTIGGNLALDQQKP